MAVRLGQVLPEIATSGAVTPTQARIAQIPLEVLATIAAAVPPNAAAIAQGSGGARGGPCPEYSCWRPSCPNDWDMRMLRRAALWQFISEHGGLRSCCRVPELGAPVYNYPPWQVMPSNGQEYRELNGKPLSAFQSGGNFTGVDTLIHEFRVQVGYDGVFNQFVCDFTGDGFEELSGNIIWRVQVDNRFVKNLGNIKMSLGSFDAPMLVPGYGFRLISGQTVSLWANVPNGSPITNGQIRAGVFGWTYPRR